MKPSSKPSDSDTILLNGIVFTHENIRTVIDDFYRRVSKDSLLQTPFRTVEDWPSHIERMTHFWWIKFGGRAYIFEPYNPIEKHFAAGFNDVFLSRWLELFNETQKAHLETSQCDEWLKMATRIGAFLKSKNEFYKQVHAARV